MLNNSSKEIYFLYFEGDWDLSGFIRLFFFLSCCVIGVSSGDNIGVITTFIGSSRDMLYSPQSHTDCHRSEGNIFKHLQNTKLMINWLSSTLNIVCERCLRCFLQKVRGRSHLDKPEQQESYTQRYRLVYNRVKRCGKAGLVLLQVRQAVLYTQQQSNRSQSNKTQSTEQQSTEQLSTEQPSTMQQSTQRLFPKYLSWNVCCGEACNHQWRRTWIGF